MLQKEPPKCKIPKMLLNGWNLQILQYKEHYNIQAQEPALSKFPLVRNESPVAFACTISFSLTNLEVKHQNSKIIPGAFVFLKKHIDKHLLRLQSFKPPILFETEIKHLTWIIKQSAQDESKWLLVKVKCSKIRAAKEINNAFICFY
jgi:hypothetical protein